VVRVSRKLWYFKATENATAEVIGAQEDEKLKSLFRDCLSYASVVGVVTRESAIGVPPRGVFR
jgi:hypothetical protein